MSQERRILLIACLMVLLLAGALGWSWECCSESRRRLQMAQSDTETCREVATAIAQQRRAPGAESSAQGEDPFNQRVYEVAQNCGVQERIRSAHPQAPHRVPNTPYRQDLVELSLENLTMEQLVRFMYELQAADSQLQVSAVTLHQPSGWGTGTLWDVQSLLLARRVYAPVAEREAN